MDVVDSTTRSKMMSQIGNKNTRPEMLVRRFLHAHGYRFRVHRTDLPGKPDIVLGGLKTCIFVHGCFWHRPPNCRYATTPKTREDFWLQKFIGNVERDQRVEGELKSRGWRVLTVWECSLRKPDCALQNLLVTLATLKACDMPEQPYKTGSAARPQNGPDRQLCDHSA